MRFTRDYAGAQGVLRGGPFPASEAQPLTSAAQCRVAVAACATSLSVCKVTAAGPKRAPQMNEHDSGVMRTVEDVHWWYATLRAAVRREVRAFAPAGTPLHLLDAGCGTGGMLEVLRAEDAAWRLAGLDFSAEALRHAGGRGFTELVQGSVDALPQADAAFDAVVSLDVLYFEGVDEARALSEFHRVLRPGGLVVLNLPAFDVLRGSHDVAVKGVRRYTPSRVETMLADAGFAVGRVHCWNLWLFAPILCWRLLSRMLTAGRSADVKSDLSMPNPALNRLLATCAGLDSAVCRALRSRLGTSVFAVAHKPSA